MDSGGALRPGDQPSAGFADNCVQGAAGQVVKKYIWRPVPLMTGHQMIKARQDRLKRCHPRRFTVADTVRKVKDIHFVQVKIVKLIVKIKCGNERFADQPIDAQCQRPAIAVNVADGNVSEAGYFVDDDSLIGVVIVTVSQNPNFHIFLHV